MFRSTLSLLPTLRLLTRRCGQCDGTLVSTPAAITIICQGCWRSEASCKCEG
jgi:hypothetical protein